MNNRKHLEFSYDEKEDILTVEGVRYSGDYFRFLAKEPPDPRWFRMKKREDGIVIVQTTITELAEQHN